MPATNEKLAQEALRLGKQAKIAARQLAPLAAAGRRHKGSLDLAKLEPAISRHPSGRILPRAGFLRRYPEPTSAITLNYLEIYETNTSN